MLFTFGRLPGPAPGPPGPSRWDVGQSVPTPTAANTCPERAQLGGDGTSPVKWMARQAIVPLPEHLDVSMPPGQLPERPGFGVGPAIVGADAMR
jgi:hypothetical protein